MMRFGTFQRSNNGILLPDLRIEHECRNIYKQHRFRMFPRLLHRQEHCTYLCMFVLLVQL